MKLYIEPRVVKKWEQFISENPPYSIALDGYVSGGPRFDEKGPYTNFNHHEEVNRLATRSTCGQVHMAIKQGLIDSYRKEGKVIGNIFVNDPDQDTCLAVWLLKNHERILGQRSEPLINKLLYLEDVLDCTAGIYPLEQSSETMRKIGWVFEPYTSVRAKVCNYDEYEMRNVIEGVCGRISKYLLGESGELLNLDLKYEIIGGGENWSLVRESDSNARGKMYADGIKAFISVKNPNNNHYRYSLCKASHFIPFPINKLYAVLNKAEGITSETDCWGGSDIVGGSPRLSGSKLTPKELEDIVNNNIK